MECSLWWEHPWLNIRGSTRAFVSYLMISCVGVRTEKAHEAVPEGVLIVYLLQKNFLNSWHIC